MAAKRKIVIMTVPFGGGHHATATTVAALLSERPGVEVEVIDAITEAWPAFAKQSSQAYVKSTGKGNGWLFKVYYQASDKLPQPITWFASAAFARYARKRIKQLQPDLIISTFPFMGHVAAEARDHHHMNTPVVTLVTDAGRVQGIWLNGREDVILTATPDTVDYARRRGMTRAVVDHVGFPVAKKFYSCPSRAAARQQLGLGGKFTVLLTAGGLGMKPERVVKLAKALAAADLDIQLVMVAGKNQPLERRLQAIDFPAATDVRVVGFADNMEQLMAASDLVISKAGWLTICESLTVGRPLLLFDAIPGQEEQNAKFVVAHDYGRFETDLKAAVDFVRQASDQPDVLSPYLRAIERRGRQAELPARLADYLLSRIGDKQ